MVWWGFGGAWVGFEITRIALGGGRWGLRGVSKVMAYQLYKLLLLYIFCPIKAPRRPCHG